MKEETRKKLQILKNKAARAGKAALGLLVPFAIGGTIGAAWGGWYGAIVNAKAIEKTNERLDETREIVFHNGSCSKYDRQRIEELTRQQNLLMEKALQITAGEEPTKENKEDAA